MKLNFFNTFSFKVCEVTKKKQKLVTVLLITCLLIFMYGKICHILQPENVTSACVMKKIDFHHPSFDKSFWYESPVDCHQWKSLVYFDKRGLLRLNQTVLNDTGYSNIKCSYSTIHFNGRNDVTLSEKIPFDFPCYVPDDFAHVTCKNSTGHYIYSDLHNKIYSSEIIKQKVIRNETEDQLSVVILGVDSVSNLVADRMLPKTQRYIKKLNSFFMSSYTKVGEDTLINLLAALLGMTLTESLALTVDLPTMFKYIKEKGYIDCYAEDWTPYRPNVGYNIPRYTHSLRKLILARKKVNLYLKGKYNISKHKESNKTKLCFGNRMKHRIVLEYARQCIEAYENKRKYVFMWINEISHHQSNYVQLADQDFVSFLQWLNNTGRMDKTVVVMMSDHGPRYGPVPETNLGRFTNRLPFMALMMPKQLTKRYPHIPKNLLTNRYRLTSHFDFYETLSDIFHKNYALRVPVSNNLPRGISLFREIPPHRSCYDAAISEDNCACYSNSNISIYEPDIVNVAYFTVDVINKFLKPYNKICAKLSLLSVESANVHHIPSTLVFNKGAIRYTVALYTTPGNALFEVTADFVNKNDIRILGGIMRRNRYNGQTDCVQFRANEQYCLCKSKT